MKDVDEQRSKSEKTKKNTKKTIKKTWNHLYKYGLQQLKKFNFNFEVEFSCRLFQKKKKNVYLQKMPLFFQEFFFMVLILGPNLIKDYFQCSGFCVGSNKRMWAWVLVTTISPRTLSFNIGNWIPSQHWFKPFIIINK
jgi:hypothetical protein